METSGFGKQGMEVASNLVYVYPMFEAPLSDLTVESLTSMREDIIGGQIQTLAFSDYEKIYKVM
jgi:hypothetical protein